MANCKKCQKEIDGKYELCYVCSQDKTNGKDNVIVRQCVLKSVAAFYQHKNPTDQEVKARYDQFLALVSGV